MAAGFGLFVSEEAMNIWVSAIALEYDLFMRFILLPI
jgi:hypothetical protein